jgi:hypothetical protein
LFVLAHNVTLSVVAAEFVARSPDVDAQPRNSKAFSNNSAS